MKISPGGWELYCGDGQTDMAEAYRNLI